MKELLKDKNVYLFVSLLFLDNCRGIFTPSVQYYGYLIGLIIFSFCLIRERDTIIWPSYKYMFTPWIFALAYSFLLVLLGNSDLSLFTHGCSEALKISVLFICGFAILSKYKLKALDFMFLSFSLAYLLLTANGFYEFGLSYVVAMALNVSETRFEWSYEGSAFDKIFEVHEFGLALPLVALAYMWKNDSLKKKAVPVLISLFISLLCAKRIAIAAFLVSFAIYWASRWNFIKKFTLSSGSWIYLSIIFIFISSLYTGFFFDVLDEYEIEMNGRDYFYQFFTSKSYFGIGYLGNGLGYVFRYLSIHNPFNDIMGLHNDVFRMYLELGAIGSFIFWFLTFNTNFKHHRILSENCCYFYILSSIYCIITYFTDNTINYGLVQLANCVIPFYMYYEDSNLRSK